MSLEIPFATADLLDANEAGLNAGTLHVVAPMFRSYGGRAVFGGPISTLKVFEDNSLVRTALSQPGNGRVLVIDGGGSLRCALVGDQLAELAVKNGWAGIVVYGCIRDSRAIGSMALGVFALATHPLKSIKRNVGEADLAVTFGGVSFVPGHFLYADADGVIVSQTALA
ncbi:putative regulator of ribonuclease activity [Sterolibacterium denitrificans]|uniref:4-hydroxy-4-methyl-2-oxoglutarate aldolase n=2 Tax=Sterolibacterium denitrificans TaxID=157592 RepID=A0A656Z8W1_9PROT|nr:ribonuclease E activity regulator RraA [Sterolibacterium denitrificans]KYC29352.1 ribonuclease activity regulator protein RraA [Sterolibacterium denitrificans]SMB31011.1 putative regulator of ribonuclease activity [Sterolibacterium denitrificans]